jgi:hypothetical protein
MLRRARSALCPASSLSSLYPFTAPPFFPLVAQYILFLSFPQVRRARLGIASVLQRGIAGITAEDLKNKRTETNQRRTNLREAQIRCVFTRPLQCSSLYLSALWGGIVWLFYLALIAMMFFTCCLVSE